MFATKKTRVLRSLGKMPDKTGEILAVWHDMNEERPRFRGPYDTMDVIDSMARLEGQSLVEAVGTTVFRLTAEGEATVARKLGAASIGIDN